MKVCREVLVGTAVGTSVTLTCPPIASGWMRIYEGRVAINTTAGRGTFTSYLGDPANLQVVGFGVLATSVIGPGSTVGISEEAGRRNYIQGEYWTFVIVGLASGDIIRINLYATDLTMYEYSKGFTY